MSEALMGSQLGIKFLHKNKYKKLIGFFQKYSRYLNHGAPELDRAAIGRSFFFLHKNKEI